MTSDARVAVAPAPSPTDLHWLPLHAEWRADMRRLDAETDSETAWRLMSALAKTRLDFISTNRIDTALRQRFGATKPAFLSTRPVRLAVLGSSTLTHLLPAIRVAGLRRDIWITTYEPDYGQYRHELGDAGGPLQAFAPDVVLFAFDAVHLARGIDAAADETTAATAGQAALDQIVEAWQAARALGAQVIQQTALPVFVPLLGNNEHRLPGSKQRFVAWFNQAIRERASAEGVDILALDEVVAQHGLQAWHDPVLWHRAKQEVTPAAAPLYGDLVGRLLAARQGRSSKCLVLDLDNTLWGGVIGDDGLDGIVVGQGSAEGEAFLSLQRYALDQAKRGVILAVCSKNDEANALAPFEQHPDMVLKRADIACFVANWDDKAQNIRRIARELNIGLDALVFVDDNPFERNLVRGELPMVAVPEVPDEPALVARAVADAGYFEGLGVTGEDRDRTALYQQNAERANLQAQAADLPAYLRSLQMELIWKHFDRIGFQRIVQLINKTNQFNLTTRRYSEDDVAAVMADPDAFGLQLRLVDRFGDNGIIAIVIGRKAGDDVVLDTWLMSCRVLGRQVEDATLALCVAEARALGGKRLIGHYVPTAKNGMVRDHYAKLGFVAMEADEPVEGTTRWVLDCATFAAPDLPMRLRD